MYAQGGIMCPVNSFKLYCSKLHPASEDLWQRPRESFCSNDHIWYCNAPLGKNTLSNMMVNISTSAKLSKRYTNHCIRATSVSALDRAGFEARHIIRATGHKSETSIKSYSRRLTESTQREMSDALSSALSAKPVVNTDVQSEQNLSFNGTELTTDDLNRIFSENNEFSEIELPTPPATISTHLQSTATTTNYRVDHQMNIAQVIPGSPQILNFPQNSSGYCNVAPNITNCTVNFYFNSK